MLRSVRIIQRTSRNFGGPVGDIPTFLCPGVLKTHSRTRWSTSSCDHKPQLIHTSQRRLIASIASTKTDVSQITGLDRLPQQCAGCGAFSQTVDQEGPGYFTLTRGSVRHYLHTSTSLKHSEEDHIVKRALESAGSTTNNLKLGDFSAPEVKSVGPPVCDRCHNLKHHEVGVSIHHPSIHSIQDTIFESPYKYNHVYHVLDAADFPMSLIPGLHKLLHLTPLRSRNRRSKTGRFYHGRKTDVSFVITRSDLLAPSKSQVDSMMPYLRAVLRDALGRTSKDARLGNIKCVSAKQAWWTKELKEEIWYRGGGGWLVGKVNVGKSQLFHNVFPKGRRGVEGLKVGQSSGPRGNLIPLDSGPTLQFDDVPEGCATGDLDGIDKFQPRNEQGSAIVDSATKEGVDDYPLNTINGTLGTDSLDTSSLLPPAPPEEDYPAMPLVSSLPGTTASPIRLLFGNGKGELIDLPGLARGDLEFHVKPEFRNNLVMRSRVRPEQQVIKPGQSILLGGFIRITPTNPDIIVMAYSFTPIKSHLTSTEKAIGTQTETRISNVENIALPGTGENISSAGVFHLKWDVTRQRTGPITSPVAVGIKPENLPYRVMATDILIEGCGWVEVVAQVRKRPSERSIVIEKDEISDDNSSQQISEHATIETDWPAVEVFTPGGKFIGSRMPMNAWLNIANKPTKGKLQGRPRRSMKGMKKLEKQRKRISSSL